MQSSKNSLLKLLNILEDLRKQYKDSLLIHYPDDGSNVVVFWDNISEYKNRIGMIRKYDGRNYVEAKKSFEKVKKEEYENSLLNSII